MDCLREVGEPSRDQEQGGGARLGFYSWVDCLREVESPVRDQEQGGGARLGFYSWGGLS